MNPATEKIVNYLRNAATEFVNSGLNVKDMPEDMREIATVLKQFHDGETVAKKATGTSEFSIAYNEIIDQLEKIKEIHDRDIIEMEKQSHASEQFSMLITSLIQYIPQQIIVIDRETKVPLILNEAAILEMHTDPEYVEKITVLMSEYPKSDHGTEAEMLYEFGDTKRWLHIRTYALAFNDTFVLIYAITDISDTKKEIIELETHAYHDSLTGLYNRAFGMQTLNDWLEKKWPFVLLFADLDSLKYVNDVFGHNEGDMYIINAGKHLRNFPENAVVCRLGGDEFMVIIPNVAYAEVEKRSAEIYANLINDPYAAGKEYSYSASFGFVEVSTDNHLPASEILSLADERMYQNKRARKKARA